MATKLTEAQINALRIINDAGSVTLRHWRSGRFGPPPGLNRTPVRQLRELRLVQAEIEWSPPRETYRLTDAGLSALKEQEKGK